MGEYQVRVGISDVAIILSSLSIVIFFAFTAETEIRWVGHALAGIFGLTFSTAAAVVGAMQVGRIRRIQGINLFSLHRKITVYLAMLIVGVFFYGLWSRTTHGELLFLQHADPLVTVTHGWFGLILMIIAIAQVLPCLVAKNRRKTKKLHMILGYALVLSLVLQTFLGVGAGLIEVAKGMS